MTNLRPSDQDQIHSSDFQKFDYILCMDQDNLYDVQRFNKSGGKAKVMLFGEFAGKKKAEEVDDPYYVGTIGTR